jgi:hypothetical protein
MSSGWGWGGELWRVGLLDDRGVHNLGRGRRQGRLGSGSSGRGGGRCGDFVTLSPPPPRTRHDKPPLFSCTFLHFSCTFPALS